MANLDSLSQRQFEVLESIAQGRSNSEIAQNLGLSINTIKSHISSIFKLLEIKTRNEAINIYKQHEALSSDFTNPKIKLVISHNVNLDPVHEAYARTLKKHLSSWNVFTADIDTSGKADKDSSNYAFLIEFSVFKDEAETNEYSWSIKRFEANKHYLNEVNYFELLSDKIDTHKLIDVATQIYQALLFDIVNQPQLTTRFNDLATKIISALHYFDHSNNDMLITANQLCDEVIKSAPSNATAHGLKALILYRRMSYFQIEMDQSNFDLLSDHALTAIKLDENNMWSQTAFAYHNVLHSKMTLAEAHFERALAINPCYYISVKMLAQIYCFNNKTEKGVALIEDTFRNHSSLSTISNFYTSLTILYYSAEQFEKAKDAAKDGLIYQDSNVPALLMGLISLSQMSGEYDAVRKYKSAFTKLNIKPEQLLSRLSLTRKIVPERSYKLFKDSIKLAGFKFGAF